MNRTGFHIIAEKGAMYCLASGLKTVLYHFRDTIEIGLRASENKQRLNGCST